MLEASTKKQATEAEAAALGSCLEHAGTVIQEVDTVFTGLALGTYYGYRSGITVLAHLMRDLPDEVAGCEGVDIDEEEWAAVFGDASDLTARVASEAGFKMSKTDPSFRAALTAAKGGHWELAGAKIAAFLTHAGAHLD